MLFSPTHRDLSTQYTDVCWQPFLFSLCPDVGSRAEMCLHGFCLTPPAESFCNWKQSVLDHIPKFSNLTWPLTKFHLFLRGKQFLLFTLRNKATRLFSWSSTPPRSRLLHFIGVTFPVWHFSRLVKVLHYPTVVAGLRNFLD